MKLLVGFAVNLRQGCGLIRAEKQSIAGHVWVAWVIRTPEISHGWMMEKDGPNSYKELAIMTTTPVLRPPLVQTLRQSPIPALRKLAVEECDGTVIISGSVSSYYLKQLAQETLLPVVGPRSLHNKVQVVKN
jgi:hypothetical protein